MAAKARIEPDGPRRSTSATQGAGLAAQGHSGPGGLDMVIVEPLCAVFRRQLKAEGQKYTPERALVLDAIIRMEGLFEADDLVARVRASNSRVSKATVYRTLRLLQDGGIVQRMLIAGDQPRYRLVYGSAPRDYLVRIDTGEIEELDIPELAEIKDRLCAQRGLQVRGHSFTVFASAP